jgi:hypothetical protein
MSFLSGVDDSQPGRPDAITRVERERRLARSGHLASGTLACARCDAPVVIGPGARSVTDVLECSFCSNRGPVRDFLSLAPPTRPARVDVRVRFKNVSVVHDSVDA